MRKALIVLILAMLIGCQPVTVQRSEGVVPISLRVDDAAYWLEEWHWVSGLPEGQQRELLATRELEFQKSDSPRNRLRLALMLAVGPRSVRNQDRAHELLVGMDVDHASYSAKSLSALLQQVIAEHDWFNDRIKHLRIELKESEGRVEELERQLQELTTIEQDIQQREIPQ